MCILYNVYKMVYSYDIEWSVCICAKLRYIFRVNRFFIILLLTHIIVFSQDKNFCQERSLHPKYIAFILWHIVYCVISLSYPRSYWNLMHSIYHVLLPILPSSYNYMTSKLCRCCSVIHPIPMSKVWNITSNFSYRNAEFLPF